MSSQIYTPYTHLHIHLLSSHPLPSLRGFSTPPVCWLRGARYDVGGDQLVFLHVIHIM